MDVNQMPGRAAGRVSLWSGILSVIALIVWGLALSSPIIQHRLWAPSAIAFFILLLPIARDVAAILAIVTGIVSVSASRKIRLSRAGVAGLSLGLLTILITILVTVSTALLLFQGLRGGPAR